MWSNHHDLFLMVGIGIFGYILRKLDFPLSPVLLGFILGGLMEQNLRRAATTSTTINRPALFCGSGLAREGYVAGSQVLSDVRRSDVGAGLPAIELTRSIR